MIADEIRKRLAVLQPTELEVIDESEGHRGHSGWREGGQTHFRVRMRARSFEGQSRIAQHRAVHAALGDLTGQIHALALELSA